MYNERMMGIEADLIKRIQEKSGRNYLRYSKFLVRIIFQDLVDILEDKGFEIVEKIRDNDVSDV